MPSTDLPKIAVAETLAQNIAALDAAKLPHAVRRKCAELLIDVIGLAVTARNEDYIKAVLAACDDDGPCTAIGHTRPLSAAAAALVNGTAIHGEDFDDTFEGGPVHAGAVIVPAVLAACERHKRDGKAALLGIAVGVETMCRLSLVAPTLTHKAGFHPTAVFGTMGAAAGVGAALGLSPRQLVDALGNAGSMAGGIIEYLAEGVHGFFYAFARTSKGDFAAVIDGFGAQWVTPTLAFKPYPCGTMTHPYIDCARRLGRRVKADDVVEMVCDVGEGTVHRLWEPLAAKQHPANGYAGKFSTPYCIATGFVRGNVALSDFTDEAVCDPAVLALAAKVRYRIDPQNPYPKNFTGHIRATLRDGSIVEERQPHMRGGAHEPLTRADLEEKFMLNAKHGGWNEARAKAALQLIAGLFDGPVELSEMRG